MEILGDALFSSVSSAKKLKPGIERVPVLPAGDIKLKNGLTNWLLAARNVPPSVSSETKLVPWEPPVQLDFRFQYPYYL